MVRASCESLCFALCVLRRGLVQSLCANVLVSEKSIAAWRLKISAQNAQAQCSH